MTLYSAIKLHEAADCRIPISGFMQEMVLFLQRLPTDGWSEKEMELVLSRAYMWRASFDQAPSHLSC